MFRIDPALPAAAYQTFEISAPLATHWRPATCAEVECDHYVHGWQTIVPSDSPAAEYIRHDKTRSHREERRDGGLACFTFGPGQRGFAPGHDHKLPVGRPERFTERGGDWRGNPRGDVRVHATPDDWVDSFANHQDKLKTRLERG